MAGTFLVSGRKVPRDGGIILALGTDTQQIEAVMAEAPLLLTPLADFRAIESARSERADDAPANRPVKAHGRRRASKRGKPSKPRFEADVGPWSSPDDARQQFSTR